MASKETSDRNGQSISIRSLIDLACDEFEAAWKQGGRPEIEGYLVRIGDEHRQSLLSELVLIDVVYRRRSEEQADAQDYISRFPDDATLIQSVFVRLDTGHTVQPTLRLETPQTQYEENVCVSTHYSQLRHHAEGGLGEVYRGDDEELHREVAIKFVHRDHVDNAEARERLQIEAEVTGRLAHPGVVPVYGIGQTPNGRPFYVMRFVEGETFREAIDRFHKDDWNARGRSARRMELQHLLEHLIAAANAVAYGHNRGVLHRDIKPDNILLGRYGETFLVDWGLAQFVQRDARAKASGEKTLMPGQTASGSQSSGGGAGTIGYMSPEQIEEGGLVVGPASDVYSLGGVLYKILTGTTAFHWSQGSAVWDLIRAGDFPRPRQLKKDCPPGLEAICLKAMARRPQERYAGAQDFAEDVRRWMADEPVGVYRESAAERVFRFSRRHQAGSLAAAVVAALLVIMAALTSVVLHRSRAEATGARLANLRTTAAFAAEMFGYEIDQRWRILGELAAEAELHSLLKAATGKPNASPERTQLQNWLSQRGGPLRDKGLCHTLTVLDAQGNQLGREPYDKRTVGRNFGYRSYFHGGPADLPKESTAGVSPAQTPQVSSGYLSVSSDNDMKVSFSVPVWDDAPGDQKKPVGMLSMSVRLGDFVRRKYPGVVLADLRSDSDSPDHRGQVLDHPEIDHIRKQVDQRVYLPPKLVDQLEQLRQLRRGDRKAAKRGETGRPPRPEALNAAYVDEVAGSARACIAAFEPVFISGRPEKQADIGWVVIVQDRGG